MRRVAILILTCVLLPGCTNRAFLGDRPHNLSTGDGWAEVPDGQKEVQIRRETALYLPVGPVADWHLHRTSCFTINGKYVDQPGIHLGAKTSFFVFQPEAPGKYRIEYRKTEYSAPVVPDTKPDKVWTITVTE
jgi:hypothetical protein